MLVLDKPQQYPKLVLDRRKLGLIGFELTLFFPRYQVSFLL